MKTLKKRKRTFTKSKSRNLTRKFTSKNFEEQINNLYISSGLGINGFDIILKRNNNLPQIESVYNIRSIDHNIRQFLIDEIQNRMQEPIYSILRSLEHVCFPHIYFSFHPKKINEDTELKLLNKIKNNLKWTPSEKKSANNELSLAYTLTRCYKENFKIIAIPIGVSSSGNGKIDHSNFLIFDLRQNNVMEMKNTMEEIKYMDIKKQETYIRKATNKFNKNKNKITAYLFEPNGSNYSKNRGIDNIIFSYIKKTNNIIENINKNVVIGNFEVVGGDHEGLQTILGKKIRDSRMKTIGKSGYPICAGIGFWVIFKWISRYFKETTLPFYINSLINSINNDPEKRMQEKQNLKDFFEKVKDYSEKKYSLKMPEILKKQLTTHIKNDYYLSNFLRINKNNFSLPYNYELIGTTNKKFGFEGFLNIEFLGENIKITSNKI